MYDVAIIGGGVVGCSIARELSRYRARIVLIEKEAEVSFGTSKTNSGIIHAGYQEPVGSLKGQLVVRGNEAYDRLREELGFGFSRIGEIMVAKSDAELETLRATLALGQSKGVRGLVLWDRDTLRREEPNLSHDLVGALFAPSAGVVNPYELTFALIESAIRNGVQILVDAPVRAIKPERGGLRVHTARGPFDTRFVLNCAGVFADEVAAMVGLHDFEIRPRKGEEYLLDAHSRGLVRRLVFPVPTKVTKGILIIPTFDGTLMVGPTAEPIDDRHDVSTTPRGAEEVFRSVRALCPAIDPRDTIAEFAGIRAASSTEDFVIGPTPVKGFVNVAGIQSPGLTAAPAIAEYVVDILKSEGLALEPRADFVPEVEPPPRFAQRTHEERIALAQADPLFGRIVCRCELVTEAEVHKAIDHGARTLDGVKFRTRAGMGRCQGGFCTTRVMEIMARRLDVPIDAITKRGRGSWMVLPMRDDPAQREG